MNALYDLSDVIEDCAMFVQSDEALATDRQQGRFTYLSSILTKLPGVSIADASCTSDDDGLNEHSNLRSK